MLEHLPPLRDTISTFSLRAKKTLGQNFLLDLNLTRKIARAAGDLPSMNVIEIGPGPGGLTRALLMEGAQSVHAIERDERCIEALQEVVSAANGRLHLHSGDAMKTDMEALCSAPRAIVANLPYNIATPLLIGWLKNIHLFDSLTLMFQKEVADRLCAAPGTKTYGRLSILAQWLCQVEKKIDLPPAAFTPPPKVSSSVVHFTPRADVDVKLFDSLERITAAAFGQRRKMLRQSLKKLSPDIEGLLKTANLSPTARAEDITVTQYIALAGYVDNMSERHQ